jgi:hypothetical protein
VLNATPKKLLSIVWIVFGLLIVFKNLQRRKITNKCHELFILQEFNATKVVATSFSDETDSIMFDLKPV